jgi:electron transfer flavoprotein beta subunit
MNIIVCVKQVAHIYVQNGYDPHTKKMVTEGLVYRINPHDEVAVEAGIRLKEMHGGSVTVITLGPERSETALRLCLAMGADHAVHVFRQTAQDLDPWTTAAVISKMISQETPDIVLFGKKAVDDEMGVVGTFVAELLNLPVVTAVTDIVSVDSEKAVVQRALDRGNREEVVCLIPAVLTVDKILNSPRYPTFPDRKASKEKPIKKMTMAIGEESVTGAKIETLSLSPPKRRAKRILSPDSNLSAAARISFVLTGGMGQKKGGTVGGTPGQMAGEIIEYLKEKNVIGT